MAITAKKEIRQKIHDFFSAQGDVIFVYLFGSIINKTSYRDVDIGIYLKEEPSILRRGKLQIALDDLLEPKVDVILLNNLPSKNPAFAYEIVTQGEVLFNKHKDTHTKYKSRVLQYYFDTAHLREQFKDAFDRRIKTHKFGERNYE